MCIGPRNSEQAFIGPMEWHPRAILKSREVKPLEYEKSQLELLILREDVDRDWEELDQEIWVHKKQFKSSFLPRMRLDLHNCDFILFAGKCR